jgi:hypothetical protein
MAIASGKSLLLPGDNIIPNNLTMPNQVIYHVCPGCLLFCEICPFSAGPKASHDCRGGDTRQPHGAILPIYDRWQDGRGS